MTVGEIAGPNGGAEIRRGVAPGEMRCAGAWTLRGIASLEARLETLSWPTERELSIDCSAINALDTSGAWLLHRTLRTLERRDHSVRALGLRAEFDALLKLIASRAAEAQAPTPSEPGTLAKVGQQAWIGLVHGSGMLSFLGEASVALLRALKQPRRIRWKPILHNLQTGGFEALPITGLLSFLLGIVIAYQGAEQLWRFGANIYIADLVGLSMVRELSPLITAIIVAGRSGSAYTAQIGTMKVTEEIDALRTIGIAPLDLLVLPKVLALVVALPLLTVYTDVMGIFGGMVMARAQLDVSFETFLDRLDDAITLRSYLIGIGKAPVFAVIIALVGCYQGFQTTGSADSVGRQTTKALPLRRRWGVMFERGALFSSLTVMENVAMVLHEHTSLGKRLIDESAAVKIALSGLPADAGPKYPSELSGGMRKRAALARALALDPELLFLDEPTAGLDPLSATGIDELVRQLRDALGLSIMIVTHDLDLLWRAADRVAVLGEGRILGTGTMTELARSDHPLIREYFYGPRGRAAREQAWKHE